MTRSWTYDTTHNMATKFTNELGHETIYDIDSTDGWLKSVRVIIGQDDELLMGMEDDDLEMTYTYNDGTNGIPKGLPISSTAALTARMS